MNAKKIQPKPIYTPAQSLMMKVGDKCAGIAENSIANKVPILEFQKLELLSTRATVLTNCMHDNGYVQNAAWLTYAEPIVKAMADNEKISFNEALTKFSRTEMQLFTPRNAHPLFWRKTN